MIRMKKMNNEKDIDKKKLTEKIKNLRINPWVAGMVIGFLAASLQKIASMTKPPAYGFCVACHVRDLTSWISNQISGTKSFFIAPVIENPVNIPVLTFIGILLGSFVASLIFKEFRVTKGETYFSSLKMFLLGIVVLNFALLLSACPIRAALRTAHGDFIALIGLLCIGVGAVLAAYMLERSVEV